MSETPVRQATVKVGVPEGLHLRPLTQLSRTAQSFSSSIQLRRGDQTADAKRPLDLMALAAACDDELVVETNGSDAGEALSAIVRLFETNFSEDSGDP